MCRGDNEPVRPCRCRSSTCSLLLALVEQTRLRSDIGTPARPLNPGPAGSVAINRGVDRSVAEVKPELGRGAGSGAAGQGLATAIGDPRIAAAERPLRMDQLGHLPCRVEALGGPCNLP